MRVGVGATNLWTVDEFDGGLEVHHLVHVLLLLRALVDLIDHIFDLLVGLGQRCVLRVLLVNVLQQRLEATHHQSEEKGDQSMGFVD